MLFTGIFESSFCTGDQPNVFFQHRYQWFVNKELRKEPLFFSLRCDCLLHLVWLALVNLPSLLCNSPCVSPLFRYLSFIAWAYSWCASFLLFFFLAFLWLCFQKGWVFSALLAFHSYGFRTKMWHTHPGFVGFCFINHCTRPALPASSAFGSKLSCVSDTGLSRITIWNQNTIKIKRKWKWTNKQTKKPNSDGMYSDNVLKCYQPGWTLYARVWCTGCNTLCIGSRYSKEGLVHHQQIPNGTSEGLVQCRTTSNCVSLDVRKRLHDKMLVQYVRSSVLLANHGDDRQQQSFLGKPKECGCPKTEDQTL